MTSDMIYEMIRLNGGDTRRINHALKVYAFAKCIAGRERVPEDISQTIEIAAVLHDIAIRHCEAVYGACSGKLQEKEGPAIARPILEKYTDDAALIARVLYLIAHHHTYKHIDGIDYQILIEADFLVNADEGNISQNAFKTAYRKFFQTAAAKELAQAMGIAP